MNLDFERKISIKLNIAVVLLLILVTSTIFLAYSWMKERKRNSFLSSLYSDGLRFKSTEQIDRQTASKWGTKYDTELSNGNTKSISFNYNDFIRIVTNYGGLIDRQTRRISDQVLVKFIRYDGDIAKPEYGRDPADENRVSVTFWPFNKQNKSIVDDGTDKSKPLNLGDLHP